MAQSLNGKCLTKSRRRVFASLTFSSSVLWSQEDSASLIEASIAGSIPAPQTWSVMPQCRGHIIWLASHALPMSRSSDDENHFENQTASKRWNVPSLLVIRRPMKFVHPPSSDGTNDTGWPPVS